MCCIDRPTMAPGYIPAMTPGFAFPLQCACGCLGKDQTTSDLQRLREHLKAELKHVESRIAELDKCDH